MKKIAIIFSTFFFMSSCTDDITRLNEDTKNPTFVPAGTLFSNAEKNMVDQMTSTNVNQNVFRLFVQNWTETTYTDESNYDIATRTIPDSHWDAIYRDVLQDLKESKKVLLSETYTGTALEIQNQNNIRINKLAEIEILTVYAYSVLVDTFGDVPYSQALDIASYPNPKYDDAQTIYKDLISRLTSAVGTMDTSYDSFGAADLIHNGDVSKWKSLANSLRLKLAINMDDLDHTYATNQALAALTDGVITSATDNAALKYLSSQPNTNPIYVDVVASGRDDFVPTTTIINKMTSINDPRLSAYFTKYLGNYVGGTPGDSNNFFVKSHIGNTLLQPTFEALIMDYSEVEFLLAEALARGIAVGGTINGHYDNAITSSIIYWGGTSLDATTYLAQPSVAYATATGTWQQKIGEQAYIALYNRGFETWTSYRRLDFPILTAPVDAVISTVPTRYTYPAAEQTLNSSNNTAAAAAIGGDNMDTKLFWDKF